MRVRAPSSGPDVSHPSASSSRPSCWHPPSSRSPSRRLRPRPPRRRPSGEVELQPESGAKPTSPGEELAPETEEPFEIEPGQTLDIEEILIQGEAGTGIPETAPISVISFDPGVLQVEGIKDIRDLSNFTPSLEIKSAFAASNPTIYIRGVGLDDFNANAASAVAIYQDGVYMQSPAGQLFQFYDVEGVEVLRGPQGSLYRNASAGAILLRSAKPSDELLHLPHGHVRQLRPVGDRGGPRWTHRPGFSLGPALGDLGPPRRHHEESLRRASQRARWGKIPPPATTDALTEVGSSIRTSTKWTNDIDYFAARGQLLLNLPMGQTETEWLLNVHGGQNRSRAFQYQHTGVTIEGPTEEVRPFQQRSSATR